MTTVWRDFHTAGLLRQDHVWITTEQIVRFHKKECCEMLCKLDSAHLSWVANVPGVVWWGRSSQLGVQVLYVPPLGHHGCRDAPLARWHRRCVRSSFMSTRRPSHTTNGQTPHWQGETGATAYAAPFTRIINDLQINPAVYYLANPIILPSTSLDDCTSLWYLARLSLANDVCAWPCTVQWRLSRSLSRYTIDFSLIVTCYKSAMCSGNDSP